MAIPKHRDYLDRRISRSIRFHPAEFNRLKEQAIAKGYAQPGWTEYQMIEALILGELGIEPVSQKEMITLAAYG